MSTENDGEIATKRSKLAHDEEEKLSPPVNIVPDALEEIEPGTSSALVENDNPPPAFVHQYHVVKHVLEYLNMQDLLRAGLVNSQWSEIVQIVRKQRKNLPYTMLIHPYLPHHKLAFEYFNGFQVSDEARDLVLSGKDGYHPYKDRATYPRQKFTGLLENAKDLLEKSIAKAYDEPQVVVTFGTSSFDSQLMEMQMAQYRRSLKERMKILLGKIQNTIPCITSFSCGVIGNVAEDIKSLEMEKMKFPCISTLAIPKVNGLRIKLFVVTKEQKKAYRGKESVETCKQLLGISETDEDQLKGIMLLHKVSHSYTTSCVVESITHYLSSNPHVALAGGVHQSIMVSGYPDESIVAAGMLIYGTEHVHVTSVALQDTNVSNNNKEKLEKLKTSLQPGEKSFAFMFACNGRGRRMHGRLNVESDLFNSMFPETPLVGAFTLGEYCYEAMSTTEDNASSISIDFAFTTVFLLMSYQHPVETQDKTTLQRKNAQVEG